MLALETHGITEILTDYEMMIYYNPYYHELSMTELEADKEDLYYKSCSYTVYDQQEGIHRQSVRVETLGEKLIAIGDLISLHERQYKAHRQILLEYIKDWHSADVSLLDGYFKKQLAGKDSKNIESDLIDHIKRELYPQEQQARDEREQSRGIDRNAWVKEALEEWKTLRGGEESEQSRQNKRVATTGTFGGVQCDSKLY